MIPGFAVRQTGMSAPRVMDRVLIALVVCCFCLPALAQQKAKPDKPLNVVWLSVEDMSCWIGPYGDHTVPTPNLDKLAAQGVTYDNAFATSPVCAPARSSIITGEFCTRIGTMQMRNGNPSGAALRKNPDAYKDIPGYEGLPPAFVRCFPEVLRAHGYYCTNNSKKDYQFNDPVTVWDESSNKATWQNAPEGKPFFAVFNWTGTHESQGFAKARQRPQVVKPEDVPVPPIYPDTPAVRDAMARTYNNIAEMDQWLGKKMKELEDAGELDNTVVIFWSDHGVGLPRGKRSCYDTGLRVPIIVRYPDGKDAGTRSERVISFVDLGPSTLSLAGIKPDERLDCTRLSVNTPCSATTTARATPTPTPTASTPSANRPAPFPTAGSAMSAITCRTCPTSCRSRTASRSR